MPTIRTTLITRMLIGLSALFAGSAALAADLQVSTYEVDPDPIAATADATFTVTVANNSSPSVNNAVVIIAIPSNFEVINAPSNFPAYCSLSGTVGSQTLTCNMPTLQGGGSANAQTFTYNAIAQTVGASASTVSISAAGNTDNNPGNDSLSITPTVRGGADLSVAKAGSAPSVIAGGTLQYSLTVTNNGPTTTNAIRVIDNLPAASDFDYTSAAGSGWSCTRSGQVVTCNYSGTAPAIGAPYPVITITGRITRASAGTISNIASVEGTNPLILDPDGNNNSSNTVVTNIEAGSDLQAVKSMPATVTVGSSANIVLTIRNTGPQAVPTGSTITDTIDASLAIGTLPSGCTASGQTVTCTSGALTATGQSNFTIPVTAIAATGGIINNTADVTPPVGFADPDFGNNTAIAPFEVVAPNADLELRSKSKSPNPVAPGANVTSTIRVRNLGPSVASYSPANPIRITDTLSADETYVSVNGTAWSCAPSGTVVTCETTGTGTLNVGSELTLSLVTQAGVGTDTTITNLACTDTTGGSAHLPSSPISPTGNDCRSAGVRSTVAAADLTVLKDVSLSPTGGWTDNLAISDSDQIFYIRLQVSNVAGGDNARTVRVTDALPNFINSGAFSTSVTQETATSGSLGYNSGNGLATWTLSNLGGGDTETMIIRVERPFESGSFTNFASVFSPDTTELNTNNNSDSADYSITGVADMTINSKSVTPNPARVGVQSTYIIGVRNDGANPADNVVVTDVIDPSRFEIIGTPTTTKPGAICSVVAATGTVTCNMGQFTRTETRQISVNVMPKFPFGGAPSFPAAHTNQATVTTDTLDENGGANPFAGNNFFNLDHTMEEPSFDLSVSKRESNPAEDDPVRFDETLNYDIRVSNFGPSRATDILVTDIPSPPAGLTMTLSTVAINPVGANGGLTLQAAPNAGCSPSGPNVLCRIDTANNDDNYLNSGSQVIFRLSFTMGGTPPPNIVTFANSVEVTAAEQSTVSGTGNDLQLANNSATQNTTVLPSTDLEVVSKTRSGALQRSVNEPVEFTIRFRNNGPSTAARVRITDALPAGFVYSATPAPSTSIPAGSSASVSGLSCSGTSSIICDIDGIFPVGAAETVDLIVNAKAQAPYSGALTPVNATDTATITPGADEFGDPLSEDSVDTNNSQSAVVQIRPSTISGTVYADNNDNDTFDGGEGMTGVLLTLTGTDVYGNSISTTTNSNGSGAFNFAVLPPSDASGYTIVETQPVSHYDLNETAGTQGGTVDNSSYGNTSAENTISGIVIPASTDATGYIFQNHLNAVIVATNDNPPSVVGAIGQANIVNAFDNDSLNGASFVAADVNATITTPASHAGVTMDPATGLVSVAPGTPADTYTIDYEICDAADPDNCTTATVTVIVTASPISATNDTVGGINGTTGATNVLDALTGDQLNGGAATTANVTISLAPGATVPAGLTFDPVAGTTSVEPNTPAGNYSFNYQICEILNPTNCAIATETVSVVAGPIQAVNDSVTGINGASGANNVLNVLTGDTRNNDPATTGEVTIELAPGATVPAGLTFNTATGDISVDPGTPAGTYFFNYRICETINPTNCSIAEARVTVVAASIVAENDNVIDIIGATGGNNVLSALDSDTLNGDPATIGTVTISLAPGATLPAGLTFDPAAGTTSVVPGTPAGTYSFDYQICENLNPANCAIATETVTVIAAPIVAVNDSASGINGADGATDVLNVLGDDTLNGAAADLSTVTISVATGSSVPAGLSFDPATGNISVDPGTPAGTYSFDYTICEQLNPTNCSTATATVTVDAAPIAAVSEGVTDINGASGANDVLNALAGDTLNGIAATTSTVAIAVAPGSTVPAGLTFDTATGNVSVEPSTPAGEYSFDYQICEILNPTNCAIATETVTVIAAPISAENDTANGINGTAGAADVLNVLTDDLLDGNPADLSTVNITVATGSSVPAGLSFDPATGNVSVDPGTPAGTYTFDYTICEILNPTNCATATATVTVIAGPITADDDSSAPINGADGATGVVDALDGDTLDNAPAQLADVTITVTAPATPVGGAPVPVLNPATGLVDVPAGTPAGTYTIDYQICEDLNPTNCAAATITVPVLAAPIVATNDNVADINGADGANNVLNALDGDTLNGAPATTANVSISLAPGATVPAGLTFDPATGNTSVAPGTPAGEYSFDYQICELLNPTNCAISTETITVIAAPIEAIDDSAADINGADGATNVLNVLDGDTLNGNPADPSTVTISVATGSTVPNGLTFDPVTGNVSVDPNTPAETYTFDYTICEQLNPTNCSTATATVEVIAAPIAAVSESVDGINGATGANDVLSALDGDTLNGVAATTGTVSIAVAPGATVPAGLSFDTATGNVSVNPGTAAGIYSFDYQICEILNPTNCAIATETVTVIAAPIAAVDDTVSDINGIDGAPDVLNVLDGDTLNGDPTDPATVTITVATGSTVPAGLTFDPATGSVSVDPSTPAGTYTFDYTICEILNPTNCATATATVTVDAAPIVATADTAPPTNGSDGGTGVINILPNDTLDGDPVDTTNVTISVTTPATPVNGGPVPTLDPATGEVDVPVGTPAGDYVITYEICEQLNPANCATATVTVPVTAGPIEAVDDTVGDINGADGASDVLNVLTGDTINGVPATTDNVTISVATGSAVPAGLTFDPATGSVSVDPSTPAGDYTFEYEICEILNPTNCTTATVTVTVVASPIEAVDDTVADINGATGQPDVLNVFDGDTINGDPATPANSTVTLAPGAVLPAGITFDPATGSVGVEPDTAEGTYTFDYQLCELLNPTNCTIATVTVTVQPPRSAVNGIVYLDDNLNRSRETGEELKTDWIVNIIRNDDVVATTVTDADGFYSVEEILSGDGYSIQFIHPASGVLFGVIDEVELPINGTLPDQNMPIDPSGVVYDAITRQPVSGALVNLVDASGSPLPAACYLDPSQAGQITASDGYYRFDIVTGADTACPAGRTEYGLQVTAPTGYADPVSTVIAVENETLNVVALGNPTPTIRPATTSQGNGSSGGSANVAPMPVVPNATAPQGSEPTTYYLGFLIAQGDMKVVNNHIPLDPFLSRTPLLVTKTSTTRTASTGDLVPYTITVSNTETAARAAVDVIDILPPGFKYVPGSSRVDDITFEPTIADRELRWENQTFAGNQVKTYQIVAVIGAGVTEGDRINTAVGQSGMTGDEVSNRAQAVVSIVPSAIFDCAEIIGKVFNDLNGDGYQNDGEPGIPGARVATVNGQLITTDEYGRYHITCAAVPDAQIGSNFVLKLDTRTIPEGYAPTSDNPQSIRLTRGKISELNFGVQRARVVNIDIDTRAFQQGGNDLNANLVSQIDALTQIEAQRLVIQITYSAANGENAELVQARLGSLKRTLITAFDDDDDWDGPPPTIETNMVRANSASGRE